MEPDVFRAVFETAAGVSEVDPASAGDDPDAALFVSLTDVPAAVSAGVLGLPGMLISPDSRSTPNLSLRTFLAMPIPATRSAVITPLTIRPLYQAPGLDR